jgi:hypothetical protein
MDRSFYAQRRDGEMVQAFRAELERETLQERLQEKLSRVTIV